MQVINVNVLSYYYVMGVASFSKSIKPSSEQRVHLFSATPLESKHRASISAFLTSFLL